MGKPNHRQQGFTLIASMLLLVLLSSVAIGLMFLANGSGHIGNNDLEANVAYYGAESGMEKLTTDLLTLYQSKLSPTQADLTALASTSAPSSALVGNMTYNESAVWTNPGAGGLPITSTSVIGHGPFAGLSALMVPITLHVSAIRPTGAAVNMTRGVQVALIPVFQFGVFSDSDLSYFPGPLFSFKGRVHTNGNLFLAADSGPLVLNSNATAHGEIIRDRLANGFTNGVSYQGNVLVPTATRGCNSSALTGTPSTYCQNVGLNDGSWTGGIPPAGYVNPRWKNVESNFAPFSTNQAPLLQLPFVQGASSINSSSAQIEIIKEPLSGEIVNSPIGGSREFNKADIRILLADTKAELHPDGTNIDPGEDIDLTAYPSIAHGTASLADGWPAPGFTPASDPWPLIPGFLRVEYLDKNTKAWRGITSQWLALGFSRQEDVATAGGTVNTISPQAILVLQKRPSLTSTKFYPLNMYDAREGLPRDKTTVADPTCYVNGIINNVELNIGNLKNWLGGAPAGTGTLVDAGPQNGYLVYFSDRRGQSVIAPKVGMYGFEDVVNSGDPDGMPDGALEASVSPSPEDVDQDGTLDVKGAINVGTGFGVSTAAGNPYQPVDCKVNGKSNAVTGARHGLKLVNGGLGQLPLPGFTVVAENPVYVQGDYNSNSGDPVWNTNPVDVTHSAAAVIADTVTLLSASWSDDISMDNPNTLNARPTIRTNYRMAIASGKNINFPQPATAAGKNDFGTDGGVHNFLRYLENWNGGPIYYRGSMVSLYYSEYATGTFKCCTMVYSPPKRNYSFDEDFLTPTNLPPGTPMLQDIENLTYWQNFAPCTSQSGGTCTN